jgi:hypothetical protein
VGGVGHRARDPRRLRPTKNFGQLQPDFPEPRLAQPHRVWSFLPERQLTAKTSRYGEQMTAAAGILITTIDLRNVGAVRCRLDGYPEREGVDSRWVSPYLSTGMARSPGELQPTDLDPGALGGLVLGTNDACGTLKVPNFGAIAEANTYDAIEIVLPGPAGTVTVTGPISSWPADWMKAGSGEPNLATVTSSTSPWPPSTTMHAGDVAREIIMRLKDDCHLDGIRQTGATLEPSGWVAEVGIWPETLERVDMVRRALAPMEVKVFPQPSMPRRC